MLTRETVLTLIETDDEFTVEGLRYLYAGQTADEQTMEATVENNGVGFSGCDANILSSFAKQVQEWMNTPQRERRFRTPLSDKQMALLRKRLKKYAGTQLLAFAEQEQLHLAEANALAAGDLEVEVEVEPEVRISPELKATVDRMLGPVETVHVPLRRPSPSCCLIEEGATLRFPTAREVHDRAAFRLQKELTR